MVARTYFGLGPPDIAARALDRLKPWVVELLALQGECKPMGPEYMAVGVALDGLQTSAFHFTRRRHFYFQLDAERPAYREGNSRLADREAALAAFDALIPYADNLRLMKGGCRPFGRDYMAMTIPLQCLETPTQICRCSVGGKFETVGPDALSQKAECPPMSST